MNIPNLQTVIEITQFLKPNTIKKFPGNKEVWKQPYVLETRNEYHEMSSLMAI